MLPALRPNVNVSSKSQVEKLKDVGQTPAAWDGPGFKGLSPGDGGKDGKKHCLEQAGPGREEASHLLSGYCPTMRRDT